MEMCGADEKRVDDGSHAPLPAIPTNCEFERPLSRQSMAAFGSTEAQGTVWRLVMVATIRVRATLSSMSFQCSAGAFRSLPPLCFALSTAAIPRLRSLSHLRSNGVIGQFC